LVRRATQFYYFFIWAFATERKGVSGFASDEEQVMPRYFFHLGFGDRTWPDHEGLEFPGRSAARAEAAAVIHDLCRGAPEENPRRWRGWFLRLADAEGEFLSLPIGEPLSVLSDQYQSAAATEPAVEDRVAELARRITELGEHTTSLLEENRQLRQHLASEFRRSDQLRACAREILSSARVAGLAKPHGIEFDAATARPRGRPRLVLIPGGVR
jgi:Domain of unknown function (DUF6894)